MIKEPNETLVMITCVCRQNVKNLVMSRAYFEEMLASKITLGTKQEREHILSILEEELSCSCGIPLTHAINRIQGETK